MSENIRQFVFDIFCQSNSASVVRMITTTALKLLSTTENAMESHTASLASPTGHYRSDSQVNATDDDESGSGKNRGKFDLPVNDFQDTQSFSRKSSEEEEEMCACSSTDGSRPKFTHS